jgi:hypothetical protein
VSATLIWGAFALRMGATAFIVVAVSWVAARLGPAIGGVVVGLPIVLAPGLGFMLFDHSPGFVAEAAAGALFSLAATQVFLLCYVALSRGSGPVLSVAGGASAWAILALPLSLVPHDPFVGLALFTAVTIAARRIGRHLVAGMAVKATGTNWPLLILRGLLAGVLVGGVTLGAAGLGPGFSGALMAFPIGFTVIAVSLHLDHGGTFAGQTAYAGLTGLSSLASFCFFLSILLAPLGAGVAFGVALGASVLVMLALTRIAARRGARQA